MEQQRANAEHQRAEQLVGSQDTLGNAVGDLVHCRRVAEPAVIVRAMAPRGFEPLSLGYRQRALARYASYRLG